jgi:hypothetical protein
MNTFTDVVFIFVFVFVILHFGVVNVREMSIVLQKLYMFVAVTIFASFLYLMKAIRRQQTIKMWDIIYNGLFIGLLSFIGHTIMFDMLYAPETQSWVTSFADGKYLTVNILLAFFVSVSVLFGKTIGYVFNTEMCND